MSKKISERQEMLNRHYSRKIIKVLAEPFGTGDEKSDISYAEAKEILKHTIHRIKSMHIRF